MRCRNESSPAMMRGLVKLLYACRARRMDLRVEGLRQSKSKSGLEAGSLEFVGWDR